MEDKKLEHEHDFDGIVELDNDLPTWWLGIFWVTIGVACFYVPYYHFMKPEKLPVAAYEAEVAAITAEREAAAAAVPKEETGEQGLQTRYEAGGWQDSAKADFNLYCMPCHAADGGGGIGPNFTDDYYLHGGKLSDMVKVITEGVPAKGMVPWKATLKPQQIENLAFFIHDLRGTTPATAKEPQGQKVDENGEYIAE